MEDYMDWYVVDKGYIEYIRKFDHKVGKVDYKDRLKLHVGVLIEVGASKFYVPLSSPKAKHRTMKNSLDFQKLEDGDGNLYAVININNMIPVPDEYLQKLKYNEIQHFRIFKSEKEKTDYIYLLQKEKRILDTLSETIKNKAQKLYVKVNNNPTSSLAMRCCNFTLLQEKSNDYSPQHTDCDNNAWDPDYTKLTPNELNMT
jgi:protein AbiQ